MEHRLKVWSNFFDDVKSGRKNYEVRYDDRDFQVGDVLVLMEFHPLSGVITGEEVRRVVTHKLDDRFGGLVRGYCVLGLGAA